MMRRSPLAPIAFLLALSFASQAHVCHPNIKTPQGQAAYTAVQVLQRVDELQNATIDANTRGLIPDATAVPIVRWCVATAKTLKATPAGWQTTVKVGWAATKQAIPSADQARLGSWIAAVDLAINSLVGGF